MNVDTQLHEIGVREGDLLLVHTSFRNARIVGGPLRLIEALQRAVGARGTLVMPTMTDGESPFDPRTTPTHEMGIVAETFWRRPGVIRSTHPGASFAAAGPLAHAICAPQPLEPPHGIDSPPGRVYALGGKVLLLGVRHSESTVMHVAESIAKVPYSVAHPCIVGSTSVMVRETDHCCRGFDRIDVAVQRGRVGHADSMLFSARDAVDRAVELLAADSLFFLCAPSERCGECERARASI